MCSQISYQTRLVFLFTPEVENRKRVKKPHPHGYKKISLCGHRNFTFFSFFSQSSRASVAPGVQRGL